MSTYELARGQQKTPFRPREDERAHMRLPRYHLNLPARIVGMICCFAAPTHFPSRRAGITPPIRGSALTGVPVSIYCPSRFGGVPRQMLQATFDDLSPWGLSPRWCVTTGPIISVSAPAAYSSRSGMQLCEAAAFTICGTQPVCQSRYRPESAVRGRRTLTTQQQGIYNHVALPEQWVSNSRRLCCLPGA